MPSPAPGWGTSKPCHHCHTGETEVCKERQGPALETSPWGSASHPLRREQLPIPGGAPRPAGYTWIPGGILTKVSSLAGVPGAIPGVGVPGAGFFPGKGVQAALRGGITLLAGMG